MVKLLDLIVAVLLMIISPSVLADTFDSYFGVEASFLSSSGSLILVSPRGVLRSNIMLSVSMSSSNLGVVDCLRLLNYWSRFSLVSFPISAFFFGTGTSTSCSAGVSIYKTGYILAGGLSSVTIYSETIALGGCSAVTGASSAVTTWGFSSTMAVSTAA